MTWLDFLWFFLKNGSGNINFNFPTIPLFNDTLLNAKSQAFRPKKKGNFLIQSIKINLPLLLIPRSPQLLRQFQKHQFLEIQTI